MTRAVREQAIDDAAGQPHRVHERRPAPRDRPRRTPQRRDNGAGVVHASFAARADILSVKVWRPDGVLGLDERRAASGSARSSRCRRASDRGHSRRQGRRPDRGAATVPRTQLRRELGHDRVLEVYAPVIDGGYAIGAFEIYADPSRIEAAISRKKHVDLARDRSSSSSSSGRCSSSSSAAPPNMLRRQTEQLRKRSKDLDGRVRAARGELARGDREPERHGRGQGSVHGRPLAARAADRASRSARSSSSRRTGSTPFASGRSSTTSASSRVPTRS